MRERKGCPSAFLAMAGALAALGATAPASAREVKATFLSVGEDGSLQQRTLEQVRYGHFVRELLNRRPQTKSREGETETRQPLPHRDRNPRKRFLILQNGKIQLHMVRSIDFSWRPSETPGTQVLALRVTLVTGTERDVLGSDLRGFESFSPPFLEGLEGTTPVRYSLKPFRLDAAGSRPGELQRVIVHSQRRAPPERKKEK